jgi:superfamily I DNA/RNA helicase
MSVITLSKYQTAVIDWVKSHVAQAGALIVEAVAGSGKTFTIVRAAQEIPREHKAVFLAFNKSIAVELGNKLPDHVESKTLNALGWAVCRYRLGKHITVERNKTFDLIDKHLPADDAQPVRADLLSIIGKAKAHGLIPKGMRRPSGTYEATDERWDQLMDKYDIDPVLEGVGSATFINWCNILLKAGLEEQNVFDFDDQLYMPVALDLPCWGYDWVIIDEAQDVSHVQRTLLRKFKKHDGRLIAVGDSRQAIYGFRGADSQSLANIGRVFKAETLPLSISYRCPRAVVEVAQRIVPHIEASDTAEDGEVLFPNEWQVESFSDDDLVVCRTTAPLIELAYKCISEGRPVHVMGREIGKGLTNVVKKAAGKTCKTIEDLHPRLDKWQERMVKKADKNEGKIAAIQDKRDCINILAAGLDTVDELVKSIEDIFSDSKQGVTLATVHKAKGLEAPRVFILNPDSMPSRWATQDWQLEQERNLQYVAVTRALETLVYLPLETVGV